MGPRMRVEQYMGPRMRIELYIGPRMRIEQYSTHHALQYYRTRVKTQVSRGRA